MLNQCFEQRDFAITLKYNCIEPGLGGGDPGTMIHRVETPNHAMSFKLYRSDPTSENGPFIFADQDASYLKAKCFTASPTVFSPKNANESHDDLNFPFCLSRSPGSKLYLNQLTEQCH